MAGQNSSLNLDNSQRKGSREFDAAFPDGVRWIPGTPVIVDGSKGYIPEATERGAPGTGNPWQGG